jgi:hypothetical protein
MTRGTWTRIVTGLLLAAFLGGCGGDPPSASSTGPAGTAPGTPAVGRPATGQDDRACPVTRPRRWRPPAGVAVDALFGADVAHGNGKLWVGGLEDDGVLKGGRGPEPDGSVGVKLGWWREVEGRLRISGRRLDGPAPPLRADVPEGYDDRGFQASGVYFPTEGCWEVTGRVGSTSLTFVVWRPGVSSRTVAGAGSARPRS